jgi:hypothetical protein
VPTSQTEHRDRDRHFTQTERSQFRDTAQDQRLKRNRSSLHPLHKESNRFAWYDLEDNVNPRGGARYDQLRKKSSTLRSRLGWQPDTLESEIYEFDDKCYHIEDDFEVADSEGN